MSVNVGFSGQKKELPYWWIDVATLRVHQSVGCGRHWRVATAIATLLIHWLNRTWTNDWYGKMPSTDVTTLTRMNWNWSCTDTSTDSSINRSLTLLHRFTYPLILVIVTANNIYWFQDWVIMFFKYNYLIIIIVDGVFSCSHLVIIVFLIW